MVILFLRAGFQLHRAREVLALNLLERHGRLSGRELVACSMKVIPRGAVYVILDDLEHQGLCTSATDVEDPHHRRIYSATPGPPDDSRKSGEP